MTPTERALSAKPAWDRLLILPRVSLCHLPTPLERLPGLSRHTGLDLWVKRDDLTGLAFGGNKSRKLEFVLADALAQGCDTLLTWAGVQSNWCRQTAAAARKCGLQPVLLLCRRPRLPAEVDGNYLLDDLLGAKIHVRDIEPGRDMLSAASMGGLLDEIRQGEEARGHHVYTAPIGASRTEGSMHAPLGSLAFALAAHELLEQAKGLDLRLDHVVMATSSGSMQAGLVAGLALADPAVRLTGVTVGKDESGLAPVVADLAAEACAYLGAPPLEPGRIVIRTEFGGEGYGQLDARTVRAIRLAAESDGLLLDPVYTGKAMAGLLDLAAQGYFARGERVVFLHTGGLPALFPYRAQLQEGSR